VVGPPRPVPAHRPGVVVPPVRFPHRRGRCRAFRQRTPRATSPAPRAPPGAVLCTVPSSRTAGGGAVQGPRSSHRRGRYVARSSPGRGRVPSSGV